MMRHGLPSPRIRHGLPCSPIRHGLLSPRIRHGLPCSPLRHGLLSPRIHHGHPSSPICHGLPSPLTRHGRPSSPLCHGLLSPRIHHGHPSSLTRHGLPSPLTRHGLPSPLTHHGRPSSPLRHGRPSPLTRHSSQNGRRPGGLLSCPVPVSLEVSRAPTPPSPLDGVRCGTHRSGGGSNVRPVFSVSCVSCILFAPSFPALYKSSVLPVSLSSLNVISVCTCLQRSLLSPCSVKLKCLKEVARLLVPRSWLPCVHRDSLCRLKVFKKTVMMVCFCCFVK